MPHMRERSALVVLKKKLKFSRVVSIQGARQTGKSVLARDLFDQGVYVTLDRAQTRHEASERPGTFLEVLREKAHQKTIVIDEAQKVPQIFDEIKSIVDENNRPGQFLLLGSTEFSHETKIRESLTGRLSRLKLYPFTVSETLKKPQSDLSFVHGKSTNSITRKELLYYLGRGGFPAIFSIRDEQERFERMDEWIKLTSERDIMQIPRLKPDPELCQRIIELLPHLEEPNLSSLTARLKRPARKLESQLKLLKLIYAIHELRPHPLGTGKPLYYLIDAGLVSHLQGGFERTLETAILAELMSKTSYLLDLKYNLYFFRTTKGSRIQIVIETSPGKLIAIKLSGSETLDHRDALILDSFQNKASREKISCQTVLLAGIGQKSKLGTHLAMPWESLF